MQRIAVNQPTRDEAILLHHRGCVQRRRPTCVSEIDVYEAFYAPTIELSPHEHDRTCITLILQGETTDIVDRTARRLEPGTLILHPMGTSHSNRFTQVVHTFELQLRAGWLGRIIEHGTPHDCVTATTRGSLIRLMTQIYEESLATDRLAPLVMESLIDQLLTVLSRTETSPTDRKPARWLLEVRDLLHDAATDNLTLSEIAARVNRHPSHVAEAFRKHFECTIGEYVRGLRLSRARRLLTDTNLGIDEISVGAGFFDQAHFTTAFRRYAGITPARFRKTCTLR